MQVKIGLRGGGDGQMEGGTCMEDGRERGREGMLDCRHCQLLRLLVHIV